MVSYRWTLALISIGILSIVTVSAFRVRLASETRAELKKRCDTCDVSDGNLGHKQSKLSSKRFYEDVKKLVKDVKKSEDEDSDEDDDDLPPLGTSLLSDGKSKLSSKSKSPLKDKNIHKISDLKLNSKSTKESLIKKVAIEDDNDSENENDDDDSDGDDDDIDVNDDLENDDDIGKDDDDGSDDDEETQKVNGLDGSDDENENVEDDDSDDDEEIKKEKIEHTPKLAPKQNTDIKPEKKEIKVQSIKKDDSKGNIKKFEKSTKIEDIKVKVKEEVVKAKEAGPKKISSREVTKEPKTTIISKDKTKALNEDTDKKVASKPVETLEKIKVKSHIEGGKLQTHIIKETKDEQLESKKADEIKEEKSSEKKSESSPKRIPQDDTKVKTAKKDRQIKPASDALQKNKLLQNEFEDFYAFFPTFAPNFSRVHNPECRRHGQILLRQLRGTKLWALNMLDATAKIPSGLLQGNGIQLGDFDQCLESRARVQLETGSIVKVQGKYCLATMDIKAEHPDLEVPVDFLQGRNLIKSRVDDPGHFVPRFSTLSWGLCVPSPCTAQDVELIVKDATKHYHKLGVSLNIQVDEADCHVQKKGDWWEEWLEVPTILTLSFYGVVLLIVLYATVQDLLADRNGEEGEQSDEKTEVTDSKKTDGFISAFSLPRTLKKLTGPASRAELPAVHGLRALATLALVVAHKFLPLAHMPYTNRVKIAELVSSPVWSWLRVGWVFTDCFLLLSGTLAAYRSSSRTSAFTKLASKYLRLTPALLAVLWFYAYVWDHISSGPRWGTLVTKNAEICQNGWWWNMLYLQNYFGMDKMCAAQSHQLALDLQLSALGAALLWAARSGAPGATLAAPLLLALAAHARYTAFRDHRLTFIAYHGVSVRQLYRTGLMSYTSALHRCSPYLVGLALGLALRKPPLTSKLLICLGWAVSAGLSGAVAWAGWDSGALRHQYEAGAAARYAAGAPLAAALAAAWLLYAAHHGYSGILSKILCSRPLLLVSRISYAMYLTQFVVFLTNAATVKTSREFTLISLIDLQEITAIFLSAIVLTLTLVIPMQTLPDILFKEKKEEESEKDKENYESANEIQHEEEEKNEVPAPRRSLLAHREVLEEIPEMEVEYESQREDRNLEEILEEEDEDGLEDDEIDDLEIIEEEQEEQEEQGEEDFWGGEEMRGNGENRELAEWEWANGNRSGAQYYRYSR